MKRNKRIFSFLLSSIMIIFTLPNVVFATESPVTLDISKGDIEITSTGYKANGAIEETAYTGDYVITGTTTNYSISVNNGTHNITLNSVNIDRSSNMYSWAMWLDSNSNVNLTLIGENTFKSGKDYAGLHLWNKSHLTITEESTGSLYAVGGRDGAGIGAGYSTDSPDSTITINGGTITAKGNNGAAGIGTGNLYNYPAKIGTITINGGIVTAIGDNNAAGIGSGHYGECGNIIINGGIITATGGLEGADIGSGSFGKSGDFSTAENGNAIINALVITDSDDTSEWSGIINNTVYGNPVINTDITIEAEKTLTIPTGSTVNIKGDIILCDGASILNNGVLTKLCSIDPSSISGTGTIVIEHDHSSTKLISDGNGKHYKICNGEGCNEKLDLAECSNTEIRNNKEVLDCVTPGYTGDIYCKDCNEKVKDGEEIKAKGEHTFGDWTVTKEATNTENGEKERICLECKYVETEKIALKTNTDNKIPNNPATGDNNNTFALITLMMISSMIITVLTVYKKNKTHN